MIDKKFFWFSIGIYLLFIGVFFYEKFYFKEDKQYFQKKKYNHKKIIPKKSKSTISAFTKKILPISESIILMSNKPIIEKYTLNDQESLRSLQENLDTTSNDSTQPDSIISNNSPGSITGSASSSDSNNDSKVNPTSSNNPTNNIAQPSSNNTPNNDTQAKLPDDSANRDNQEDGNMNNSNNSIDESNGDGVNDNNEDGTASNSDTDTDNPDSGETNTSSTEDFDITYDGLEPYIKNTSFIREQFDSICTTSVFSFNDLFSTFSDEYETSKSKIPELINKYLLEVDINSSINSELQNIIYKVSDLESSFDLNQVNIVKFFSSAIFFLFLIVASLVGWITCCSCAVYDYCPIICKKSNLEEKYSNIFLSTPINLMFFTSLGLIIPSIFSYVNFK